MTALLTYILEHEEAFKSKTRQASLWSDFTAQRTTNPEGYAANVSTWRHALFHAARAGVLHEEDALVMRTGEGLVKELEHRVWGVPAGLAAVIDDAISRRDLIPLKEYEASTESIYRRGWRISPLAILAWTTRQLGLSGRYFGSKSVPAGQFVIMPNLEFAAKDLIAFTKNLPLTPTSRVLTVSNLQHLFRLQAAQTTKFSPLSSLSNKDLHLLLTNLSRDKPTLSYDPPSQTIRIPLPTDPSPPPPISEQDRNIASLLSLLLSISSQISPLESQITHLDTEARAAISSNNALKAKTALRRKKLLAQELDRRTDTLLQLEDVRDKIDQAATQVEMVRVMQASASVLRQLHAEIGSVERVQDVVEALREEMGNVDEVGRVIGQDAVGAVDEEEVEREFRALERGERERVVEVERRERERREEVEAEETRRRLAALGGSAGLHGEIRGKLGEGTGRPRSSDVDENAQDLKLQGSPTAEAAP